MFLEGNDPPGSACSRIDKDLQRWEDDGGRPGDPARKAFYLLDELYGFDNRIGIGVDMHALTSAEGELYGIRLLALKEKVHGRDSACMRR